MFVACSRRYQVGERGAIISNALAQPLDAPQPFVVIRPATFAEFKKHIRSLGYKGPLVRFPFHYFVMTD